MGDWAKTRLNNLSETDKTRDESKVESGFGKNVSNWVGRDKVYPTNVIHMSTECSNRKHSATFPEDLPTWFIKLFTQREDIVLDPTTGASLNCTNLGYRLPTILDVPTMDLLPYEDEPNPCTPHGQRGVGESALALTQPAIHNAIYNAIGVSIPDAPMSPDRILKALGKV